jgi:transposase InsO family protein
MDQFTRRIVGFAVHRGVVDGVALCRMFNRVIQTQRLPKYLSSDHDPLYGYHQWEANLRVLEIQQIKTVPYVPLSHPFVERLIGTIRREQLEPNIILDRSRSGRETPCLPGLFQQASRSLGLKRTAARSRGSGDAAKLCFVPVAEALSRTVSDACRRVISGIRQGQVEVLGIKEVLSAPRSPWQRAYVERVIGSIRRECLDHVVVFNEESLRRTLRSYLSYYHKSRLHFSLDKDSPDPRPVQSAGEVVAFAEVDGLHHRYERRAA